MSNQLSEFLKPLGFEEALVREMEQSGRLVKISEDLPLISSGTTTDALPLVLEGTLRVMREDEEGHEVFLYYLEGGDACAMSISCCMSKQMSKFKAVAETDTVLWMVPMDLVDDLMGKYRSFRKFVIDSYQERFDELMLMIDSIAFMNMDERLMKYLLDKQQSAGSFIIHKTHEQIAQELNTSRVVVSRLLKRLEKEGKVELFRNRVELQ